MSHPIKRIIAAEHLTGFEVLLRFDDGVTKSVDLEPYLIGPIFAEIRQTPSAFRSMGIDGGTITWPNGADIDPLVLYYQDLQPAR
jgi:hypothetical protein